MASPKQAELRHLLPQETPHLTPLDAALTPGEPEGKLLFALPFSTLFRPWVLGWSIVAVSFMMAAASRNRSGITFIVFTWLLISWNIIATVSHHIRRKNSHHKGRKLDFGAFLCVGFGGGESGDGDDPKHLTNRRCGQPLVDLAWAVIFFVFAPVVLRSRGLFYRGNRVMIIVCLFIIAGSQVAIAIIGFIPALRRFQWHLYKEESEDEGHYRIQLPQEPDTAKPSQASVFA